MLTLLLAVLHVGLYPANLPDGVAAQLHDAAAALPGVKAFDVIAHSACAADEIECLAVAARRSGMDSILSASVEPVDGGFQFALRSIDARGKLLAERRGEVSGDVADLGGALEFAVCEALAASPCSGTISLASAATVDGVERPAGSLQVAIGEHSVAGERVRVSFGRTVRVGRPILELDTTPTPARSIAGRATFVTGAVLLAAAAGLQFFSHSPLPRAVAATGAGAVVASGLLFSLSGSF